jgi:hypothetical protein
MGDSGAAGRLSIPIVIAKSLLDPATTYTRALAASPMRQAFFILFYFSAIISRGQVVDKTFIDNWIKLCDSNIQVDSVRAYYVDRKMLDAADTAKFNTRLNHIPIKKIRSITYSRMKMDNYVPGSGSVYLMTIEKKDHKTISSWISRAKKLYRHILTKSKDPALIIDGEQVAATKAKETLKKMDVNDVYDISVVNFFPGPTSLFGENARNGLVQIWTKKNYRE